VNVHVNGMMKFMLIMRRYG